MNRGGVRGVVMGDSEEVTMSHTRTMLGLASAATLTLLAAACGSTSTTPAATTSPAASSSSGSASPSAPGVRARTATTKPTEGSTRLTVGGWPRYTFAKDHQARDVTGQGIKAFG